MPGQTVYSVRWMPTRNNFQGISQHVRLLKCAVIRSFPIQGPASAKHSSMTWKTALHLRRVSSCGTQPHEMGEEGIPTSVEENPKLIWLQGGGKLLPPRSQDLWQR